VLNITAGCDAEATQHPEKQWSCEQRGFRNQVVSCAANGVTLGAGRAGKTFAFTSEVAQPLLRWMHLLNPNLDSASPT